jgi:REP element-mobilizing transposase RayT
LPLITDDVRAVLYPVLLRKARELDCTVHALGGIEDHVHMLVAYPAPICMSEILKGTKGASSHAMRTAIPDRFFKWQGSYGAITVSPAHLPRLIRYIENQADHHRRGDLDEELERAAEPDGF